MRIIATEFGRRKHKL